MKSPTPETIEAIQRLRSRPEGVVIHTYLQQTLDDINMRFAMTEDAVKLRILQGQAQVVRVLLEAFKS